MYNFQGLLKIILLTNSYFIHSFYRELCNRFSAESNKYREQSQTDLQKYKFYYDRYMNHVKSLKFENEVCINSTLLIIKNILMY